MNSNIIGKILTLPEDIIREVASYFIQKISKTDTRRVRIERLLFTRRFSVTEGFYSDGEFRYKIFSPNLEKQIFFILQTLPKHFIEYIFLFKNRTNSIRFWITEDKCEVAVDGYWVVKPSV